MDQHYSYRKALASDAPQLKTLALRAYGQYAPILGDKHWITMENNLSVEQRYTRLLEQAQCFICETGEKIIGMAFLIPRGNPTEFFDADWCYIRLIGIDPDHEGKGIGRRLTEQCIDVAKQSGEEVIALHTSEFQNAARHIYESLGFKRVKELDPIYEKRYWLYTLDLNNIQDGITYARATVKDIETIVDLRIQFAAALHGDREPEVITKLKGH